MARRGPKPKPTALRKLEGDWGRKGINELEPSTDLPPIKPDVVGMDQLASVEWDRIIAAMPPGIYSALDVGVLTAYCLAWSTMVKAQAEIDENGIMIKIYKTAKDGTKVLVGIENNPAARLWARATETILKTTDRLGLSPGVRSRLKLPEKASAKSKFAGLIAGN